MTDPVNVRAFLDGQQRYFAGSYEQFAAFGGPSVYFHRECLRAAETAFLSVRHVETLYATLASWGMHRMGGADRTKTKLTDWDRFCGSIMASAPRLEQFRGRRMLDVAAGEYLDAIKSLRGIYKALDLTQAEATVVVNSKALHHILPEFIPPIDRQYTIRFLTQPSTGWRNAKGKFRLVFLPPGFEDQFRLFCETCEALKRLADRVDPALFEEERRQHGVPVPKALDNAIVNYVRIVGRIPPGDEPAEAARQGALTRESRTGSNDNAAQQRGTPMPKPSIDEVWARLKTYETESFVTKRGLPFKYTISGAVFHPNRTTYNISRGEFGKALALAPFDGPGVISKIVRGPTYVWAVLHDARIRVQDW
jgi:hypothetical protein